MNKSNKSAPGQYGCEAYDLNACFRNQFLRSLPVPTEGQMERWTEGERETFR